MHPRFPLATTVTVREANTDAAILAQIKNISLSGCYLETPRQIPQGARVRVVLETAGVRADVWGVVRRRDAAGVGLQFTNGTTVEDWKRLESLLKELQATIVPRSAAASG
ncbi:MAG: PilZ domain-containing protein [Terriglobales bacterium]